MFYVASNKLFTPNDMVTTPSFMAYKHPLTAAFIYPSVANITDFHVYEAHGTPKNDRGYYCQFDEIQIIKECVFTKPQIEQYTVFAIICSLCLVENQIFKAWALDYLQGNNTSGEYAYEINNKILEGLQNNPEEYISPAFPTLACVMLQQPMYFAGNAAHRAFYDSLDKKSPIDLEKMALIATQLSPQQIHDMLNK